MLVVIVVWYGWKSTHLAAFPTPRLSRPQSAGFGGLATALPPRPEVPSIPGLKEKVPRLVPGLEDMDGACSPCLTQDLRTIVFAAPRDPKSRNTDLFIATRANVVDPFGAPQVINTCATPGSDSHPALSPDGLEVIFIPAERRPEFYQASRAASSGGFGMPMAWSIPGLEESHRFRAPRFLDARRFAFTIWYAGANETKTFVAHRPASRGEFASMQELPLPNPDRSGFMSSDLLRSYSGSDWGFFVYARGSDEQPFGPRVQIVSASVTGRISGPVWVAPNQDLVVYASPGRRKPADAPRKLWMMRF